MRRWLVVAMIAVLAVSVACAGNTKHDILKRAEKIETKAELERVLGRPDEHARLGPVETWTYHASDGDVIFLITGDKVRLHSTSSREDE